MLNVMNQHKKRNQNHNENHIYEDDYNQKTEIISTGDDVERWLLLGIADGNVRLCIHYGTV